MESQINTISGNMSVTLHALLKIDSSIRNGQLVYAYRQASKLLADLRSGNCDVDITVRQQLLSSVKRTVLFLKPLISPYAQNQSSIDIVRRSCQCQSQQNSAQ